MFATLHAGIGVKKTHSYARSLIKGYPTIISVDLYLRICDGRRRYHLNF